MKGVDKRIHRRVKGVFRVRAEPSSDLIIDWSCDSMDISEGGIGLLIAREPIQGNEIEVRFTLPGSLHALTIHSRVAWTRPSRDLKGMFEAGIEFLNSNYRTRTALRDFIAKH